MAKPAMSKESYEMLHRILSIIKTRPDLGEFTMTGPQQFSPIQKHLVSDYLSAHPDIRRILWGVDEKTKRVTIQISRLHAFDPVTIVNASGDGAKKDRQIIN
jgi:hypothetical protein